MSGLLIMGPLQISGCRKDYMWLKLFTGRLDQLLVLGNIGLILNGFVCNTFRSDK